MDPKADHDLLVRIDEKVLGLIRTVEGIKDDFAGRIAVMEENKLDKETAMTMKKDADTLHADHETRIRRLERWGAIAVGALYVIEFLIRTFKV